MLLADSKKEILIAKRILRLLPLALIDHDSFGFMHSFKEMYKIFTKAPVLSISLELTFVENLTLKSIN